MIDNGTPPGGAPEIPQLSTEPPAAPLPMPTDPAATAAPEKKRKRGRPKKGEPPAPPTTGPSPEEMERTAAAIGFTFGVAFGVIGKYRGEHWLLTDEEIKSLGQVWAVALAPYMDKIGPAMPWIAVAATTGGLVIPRVQRDRELQADAAERTQHARAKGPDTAKDA